MNSLSSTRMFTFMDKLYGITKIIGDQNFKVENYTVDLDKYDYLLSFLKGYKFPLIKNVLNGLSKEEIMPLCLAEPKDKKNKAIIFPQSITGFLRRTNKGLVSFVDVSPRAKYVRTKQTDEIEFFKISERDFYTFMQIGFLNKFCNENSSSLEYNTKFTKLVAECYAFVLFKCISSTYPIAANKDAAEILIFLCAVYAFQNFFDYDLNKATALALTLRGVGKSNVMNNCNFYIRLSDNFDMRPSVIGNRKGKDEKGRDVQVFPIDVFLAILTEEFPILKNGKFEYRNLVQRFTTMYGANSVLAIEHFFSFLSMIEMSHMKIEYYNDMGIDNACATYVNDINSLISTM